MANEITASTTSTDQEKFVVAKLIQRLQYKLLAFSVCEKVKQKKGAGTTAYFIRYKRMNVPLTTLTEGTDPANSTFSVESFTCTMDQWGDVITITDVAELTTLHPLLQEAINLLSDNAQRVIDREVQIVWFTGTNVMYSSVSGSITTRAGITSTDKITDTQIHRAVVALTDSSKTGGAQPRFGPGSQMVVANAASAGAINGASHYLAICGTQVMRDVMQAGTSLGTWASVMMYNSKVNLYNSEVGTWLGCRWVETNFIPILARLGNNTAAVTTTNAFGADTPTVTTATSGGALKDSTTFFYKVARKNLLRGFEEDISLAHSTATGAAATADDNAIAFYFDSANCTAGYVYNLYFDTVAAGGTGTDATMKLVSANIAVGATVTVTAAQTTGATAPANTANGVTVHPIYFHGAQSCYWTSLQDLQVMITKDESIIGNVLRLKRAIGYKFMAKTMIADQARLLRFECTSSY